MNLAAVIARLADQDIAAKGLAALAKIKDTPPQVFPALFVAPERETGQAASAICGVHDQSVTCDFMVVIYLSAASASMDADLTRIRAQLQDALVAWVHPDAEGFTTEYLGGQLYQLEDGKLAWFERFRTRRRIRIRFNP